MDGGGPKLTRGLFLFLGIPVVLSWNSCNGTAEIVPNYARFAITRWNRVVTDVVILLTGVSR
ncbi:hypothetical protein ADL35_19535 [Streptomyces sp. NRRL WC-3753]|nr:hypothetical protein ADL35_19535 [Streptomyces sp. NRRL WC-3753]